MADVTAVTKFDMARIQHHAWIGTSSNISWPLFLQSAKTLMLRTSMGLVRLFEVYFKGILRLKPLLPIVMAQFEMGKMLSRRAETSHHNALDARSN